MKSLRPSIVCVLFLLSAPLFGALAQCPVSLSNPDGQALTLEKYDLRVAVHGNLSLAEMEMVFRNPLPRQIEGRFLYLLPPGATISRFAKEVNGRLMEGEVVERMRAQSVYTEILQSMRDPALLEMDQGNRFSARVFPIPANGTTRLVLSYSQLLNLKDGERKLVIPMAGMPKIGEFTFNATGRKLPGESATSTVLDKSENVDGDDLSVVVKRAKDFTPEKDIELSFKLAGDSPIVRAIKAGNFQMLSYRPELPPPAGPVGVQPGWTFYFDTSASNADMASRRIEAISSLLKAGNIAKAQSWYFDVAVEPARRQDSTEPPLFHQIAAYNLRRRNAVGATNLEAALKHIGEQARTAKDPQRFVLVTDGIATLGKREVRDILAALGDWPEQHVLHALVLGSKQDEKMLSAIAEKTHGRVVTLTLGEEMEQNIPKAIAELQAPLGNSYEFYDEGAKWIYPRTFRDVRPGSEVVVFSELKDGAKSKPGMLQRDALGKASNDKQLDPTPVEIPDFAPLLQREAYRAFLDHLEKLEQAETLPGKQAELHAKRIEVSVKNRVLCPLTSLLVLETENDYQRFGIPRTALADVMVIGAKGIELKKRTAADLPPPAVRTKGHNRGESEARKLARKADVTGRDQAKGDDDKAYKLEELSKATKEEKDGAEPKPDPGNDNALALDALPAGRGGEARRQAGDEAPAREVAPAEYRVVERAALADNDSRIRLLNEQIGRSNEPRQELRAQTDTPRAAAAAQPAQQAAAAPVAPPAINAPAPRSESVTQAQVDRPRTVDGTTSLVAGVPPGNPEWVKQYGAIPTDAELGQLQAQVNGNPRDRSLRNAYATALMKAKKWDTLQGQVFEWQPFDPENPQVYEFLGNSAANLNDSQMALRAFTSIAEVAPNRAALLARAGWLLMTAQKHEMAEEMFREALKNRQDDCNIYRGLALTHWLRGNFDAAATVLEDALKKDFNARYGDTKRVLREELGYVFRTWMSKEPADRAKVEARAQADGVNLKRMDALRVTLAWETDGNDVDLHIVDPKNEECFYSHPKNASGLELYSDQTQGLGPEVIRSDKALAGTYHIGVNYFSAGPMGVSRGVVVIMQPKDGVIEHPIVAPFCLIQGGSDMRHLGAVTF